MASNRFTKQEPNRLLPKLTNSNSLPSRRRLRHHNSLAPTKKLPPSPHRRSQSTNAPHTSHGITALDERSKPSAIQESEEIYDMSKPKRFAKTRSKSNTSKSHAHMHGSVCMRAPPILLKRSSTSKDDFYNNLQSNVSAFLTDLGFGRYIPSFREHGFATVEELKDLTNDEFKEIGVSKIADRKKIQKGIISYLTTNETHIENASDGTKVKHKTMRKIFFTDELKDIPKIFLIDACRTDDAKDEEAQTSPHTPRSHPVATFSSTLMSSEGHKVHGAKICKFVTAELGDSYDNHRLPDFRTVYTAARIWTSIL